MTLGSPDWLVVAVAAGACLVAVVSWAYRLRDASRGTVALCAGLKLAAVLLLCLVVLEPLVTEQRARPGANHLLVLVDESASLRVRDRNAATPRSEEAEALVSPEHPWLVRAGQDFDVHAYAFGSGLRALELPAELAFQARHSSLAHSLRRLAERWNERPVAGIVLVTDGLATDDLETLRSVRLPPVHAVVLGDEPRPDLAVMRVDATQTPFEESPVTVRAELAGSGIGGELALVTLSDAHGALLAKRSVELDSEGATEVRFDLTSEEIPGAGVQGLRVSAELLDRQAGEEATEENNARWTTIDRGAPDRRVLYVSGRPSWEFKFLRRALEEDEEVDLVGLVRIAKRQPRFSFRDGSDRRNQLWDGFDNRDEDVGEQIDEPVLLRLGTRDADELRRGFPRDAEELFAYDALVIDDVEASFFSRDQLALIEEFVARRGGGLLALGGEQGLGKGGYRRTPLGDLLPIYLDDSAPARGADAFELELTREGWLEPWVRLRSDEGAERERLEEMPAFRTLNVVGAEKPGAVRLIEARDALSERSAPALVTQRFGKGRSAALLVGDLWRWDMRREDPGTSDLGTAWRQLLRWLVNDTPGRVTLTRTEDASGGRLALRARVLDAAFEPMHDATAFLELSSSDGAQTRLELLPHPDEAGVLEAELPETPSGFQRAVVTARDANGEVFATSELGWIHDPGAAEFRRLRPERDRLAELARATGGSTPDPDELLDFAQELVRSDVPITDEELEPLWNRWWVLALALFLLCSEWGLRRWRGLP